MTARRALLVRAGALGDVLLLRRAVFALRRAAWSVALLAPRASGSVLVGSGECEVFALIDWERADVAALADSGAVLPRSLADALHGFDLALACSRSAALAAQLGTVVPRVLAVDPAPPPGVHASRWYSDALAPLGIEADDGVPSLVPTEDERAQAAPWLARLPPSFLALHPGSGSPAKNWPADRFAAVARALSPGRAWLLASGPADQAAAAVLAREPGAVHARDLPPRVLGALLTQAGLYIGNDSGATHLAAAFGARTLALFGPSDPARWAPHGARVTVLRAPDGAVDRLSVDEVARATGSAT